MAPPRLTDEQRRYNLEHKQVKKVDGHWIWQGVKHKGFANGTYGYTGYGLMCIRGKSILAHRYAYQLFKGPISEGDVIDQTCNIKLCVNPDCLEAKTQTANVQRYYKESYHHGIHHTRRSEFSDS